MQQNALELSAFDDAKQIDTFSVWLENTFITILLSIIWSKKTFYISKCSYLPPVDLLIFSKTKNIIISSQFLAIKCAYTLGLTLFVRRNFKTRSLLP